MNYRDVTLSQFDKETKNKKIICVGCGELLERMFLFLDSNIIDRVVCIADNYKSGMLITLKNRKIRVFSVEEAVEDICVDTCILITTLYCKSIYEQLNKLYVLKDIDCYIYTVMSFRVDEYEFPKKEKIQIIPKVIHWFWFGKGEIPKKNQECIDSWRKFCPDYEIIKWTEAEYDISQCNYMKQAYQAQKWGFVPDYARLDVVYQYGGIYLDTDIELCKSLDDLLNYRGFAGFERNFQVALGLGFGAAKGNSLISAMRDDYKTRSFYDTGKLNLMPSPCYQTMLLKKMGLCCNNMLQNLGEMVIFPTDVFDPKGSPYWEPIITENTHSIHHYSESWVDSKEAEIHKQRYMETSFFRKE